jgi:hypothetical protein
MNLHVLGVVGFERSIVRLMKVNEDRHDLARMHVPCSLPLPACVQLGLLPLLGKTDPKIIDSTKQFE